MYNTIGGQNYIETLEMLDFPKEEIMDMTIKKAEDVFRYAEAELEGSKWEEDRLPDYNE
jgi:hypothetical protein